MGESKIPDMARVTHGFIEALHTAREAALVAAEHLLAWREVTLVTQAKITFSNEMGYRPTLEDLVGWAYQTGRHQLGDFLVHSARSGTPHILGLFYRELPSHPHQETDHDREHPDHLRSLDGDQPGGRGGDHDPTERG